MKIYVDSEFIDDGKTVDLISLAMVAEDGRELYLQSVEFNEQNASPWVQDNVIDHLVMCPCCGHQVNHENGKCRHKHCPWRTRIQIAHEVAMFCDPEKYGKPEFIGWCSGYDWVALCQLYGTMMDIPAGWPHYIKDLQFVLDVQGITDDMLPQQETGLHNALADAKHIQLLWNTYYKPGEK